MAWADIPVLFFLEGCFCTRALFFFVLGEGMGFLTTNDSSHIVGQFFLVPSLIPWQLFRDLDRRFYELSAWV